MAGVPQGSTHVEVALEVGSNRVFAIATDWPGWCRSGRDEAAALEALLAYGPRYAGVLRGRGVRFSPPRVPDSFKVSHRVKGNATTDFGAPDGVFRSDDDPLDGRRLRRLRLILEASWAAIDRAVDEAEGIELRKGSRGGGRELDAITAHVVQAEASYTQRLAAARPETDGADPWSTRVSEREAVIEALQRAVHDGLPEAGPRGGKLWTPRRFLRRAAWHVLDHAWEIQDRAAAVGPAG